MHPKPLTQRGFTARNGDGFDTPLPFFRHVISMWRKMLRQIRRWRVVGTDFVANVVQVTGRRGHQRNWSVMVICILTSYINRCVALSTYYTWGSSLCGLLLFLPPQVSCHALQPGWSAVCSYKVLQYRYTSNTTLSMCVDSLSYIGRWSILYILFLLSTRRGIWVTGAHRWAHLHMKWGVHSLLCLTLWLR